jgi:outer membrane protein assembly factor BamD
MKVKVILNFLLVCLMALAGCSKFSKIAKSKDNDYKLKMADMYYEQKKYAKAQILYTELFQVFKGGPEFENIYYKSSYCYYYQELYLEAESYFKGFLEVYPTSPKAEEMDFMYCMSYYKRSPKVELEQTNTAKTIGQFQSFINRHPNSPKIKEANDIIDECRLKLELKDARACELYYALGQYKAAAIAYNNLLNSFPESTHSEDYKLKAVKAYYSYAKNSIEEKQVERYEKVIEEYRDFSDRFPESKLGKKVLEYYNLSVNNIKALKNE